MTTYPLTLCISRFTVTGFSPASPLTSPPTSPPTSPLDLPTCALATGEVPGPTFVMEPKESGMMILNTSAYPISRNTLLMEGFLAKGSKLLMSSADAVRSVAVLHSDLIPLDQQLCHMAAGIVAVSEGV